MGRGTGKRQWAVFGPVDPTHAYPEGHPNAGEALPLPVDPGEVEQMAADVATVVRMVGGTCLQGADRVVDPVTNMWITTAVYWEWHSFAPPSQGEPASRGKRGGQQQRQRPDVADEFQQPEAEPQEPEGGDHEDDIPDEEFMPLTPEEQAQIERAEALS